MPDVGGADVDPHHHDDEDHVEQSGCLQKNEILKMKYEETMTKVISILNSKLESRDWHVSAGNQTRALRCEASHSHILLILFGTPTYETAA
jgi:hypothetical protein